MLRASVALLISLALPAAAAAQPRWFPEIPQPLSYLLVKVLQ